MNRSGAQKRKARKLSVEENAKVRKLNEFFSMTPVTTDAEAATGYQGGDGKELENSGKPIFLHS